MKRSLLALFLLINFTAYGLTVTSGITSISGTGTHINPQLVTSGGGAAMAIWTESFPDRIEAAYFTGRYGCLLSSLRMELSLRWVSIQTAGHMQFG